MDDPSIEPRAVLLVGLGGFLGAALRYGVDGAVGDAVGAALPIPAGTLAVNVAGAFLLGALSTIPIGVRRVRLFVATGGLSSFTTYSTFAVQTASLGPALGALNVGANYVFGFLAAAAGLGVGRALVGRRVRGRHREREGVEDGGGRESVENGEERQGVEDGREHPGVDDGGKGR